MGCCKGASKELINWKAVGLGAWEAAGESEDCAIRFRLRMFQNLFVG